MGVPKHFQHAFERYDARVKGDLRYFGMACLAGAHFTVGGILHRSAGVTRLDFRYTLHIEEYGFGTPETPGAKSSYLGISTHFIFVWFLTMTQACGTQGHKKKGRIFHYPYNRISARIVLSKQSKYHGQNNISVIPIEIRQGASQFGVQILFGQGNKLPPGRVGFASIA